MEFSLFIGSLFSLGMGFAMTFDQNPCLCKTLKIKFILSKKSFLRIFFLGQENRGHPYSYFRIIPFFISILILVFVLPLYVIYTLGFITIVNEFVKSELSYHIGFGIIVLYFIYPLFLLLINKACENMEKLMSKENKEKIEKKYENYYSKLDK